MWWSNVLDALGASTYSAHSFCLSNDPILLFLFTMSDLSTFFSYFVIGGVLLYLSPQILRGKFPNVTIRPSLIWMFGAFILACGLSHLTMVMTLYAGVYRLDVVVRAAMAGISVVTAAVVFNDFLLEPWTKKKGR